MALARWILWPVFLIGSFVVVADLNDGLWRRVGASIHAGDAMLALVVSAALIAVVSYHQTHRPGALDATVAGFVVSALLLLSAVSVNNAQNNAAEFVSDYCRYGSVSRAQLNGCVSHVTPAYIRSRRTAAARFARDTEADCGSGAGPFCREVIARRVAEAIQP